MRLIDADALLDDIIDRICSDCDKRKGIKDGKWRIIYSIGDAPCRACSADDTKDDIDSAPTVDAVAIVRCGNCAKRGKNGKGIPGGCPFGMTDDTCDPNAYCSYGVLRMKTGERKDNGT